MNDETLKLFLDNLRKSAEYCRIHSSISVDRYAALCDVAFALECALDSTVRNPEGNKNG